MTVMLTGIVRASTGRIDYHPTCVGPRSHVHGRSETHGDWKKPEERPFTGNHNFHPISTTVHDCGPGTGVVVAASPVNLCVCRLTWIQELAHLRDARGTDLRHHHHHLWGVNRIRI